MALPSKPPGRPGSLGALIRQVQQQGRQIQGMRRLIGGSSTQGILDTGLGPGMFDPTPPYGGVISLNSSSPNSSNVYDALVYFPDYSLTIAGGWVLGFAAWAYNLQSPFNTITDPGNSSSSSSSSSIQPQLLTIGDLYEGVYQQSFIVGTDERPLYRFRGTQVLSGVRCVHNRIVETFIDA